MTRIRLLLAALAAALLLAAPAAAADRFVALSPFTANTLADVGVRPVGIANTLGGSDRWSPKLKGVKRLELSHPNGPNLEQLASLNPSVVLSSPTWNRGHAAMKQLGMDVELVDPYRVDDVPKATQRIAAMAGQAKLGAKLARKQARDIKRARKGIKQRPSVLLVLGVGRSPYAFLPNSWGGDVVAKAGGRLLTGDLKNSGGFAQVSNEFVVQQDPDVIIAVPHGLSTDIPSIGEYLQNNPAWATTKAARNKRIYVATGNSLLQAYTDTGRTIRDVRRMYLQNG
jgi:iron complex transport system substrate-binding protein